jgi:ketosteroid isomerase-like protein
VGCAATAIAGETKASDLKATVAALDAALFDAYNKCDLEKMGAMVADDLEFYHDQSGLMRGRAPFIEAIKKNICGKVRRALVEGTLEVHPLNTYGAVEIGVHTFCQTDAAGQCKSPAGPARFVQLWQNRDGTWLLTRVISFDHH